MSFSETWLNSDEAARYVRCLKADGTPSPDGMRMLAKRHQIATGHRGRRVVYLKADLDAFLVGAPRLLRKVS